MACDKVSFSVDSRPGRPEEWNDAVSSFDEGTFFQSTHWGDYLNKYKGCRTYYILMKENGNTAGMALMWSESVKYRNIPVSSRAFTFYGPLLKDYRKNSLQKFLPVFDRICRKDKIVFTGRIALPMHFSSAEPADNKPVMIENGYSARNWATIFMDLRKSEEELEGGLEYSAKKCIKKNIRERIEVGIIRSADEYAKYNVLMDGFLRSRRTKLPYFTPGMWDFLCNGRGCMEIFNARRDGEMLGGMGALYFNGIVFEIAQWRSDYAIKNNLNVGDAIKWEVIRWAKKKGFRMYDLGGVNPEPLTEKEIGIKRFKQKWGGREIVYSEFSKIYRRLAYRAYESMKKIYGAGKNTEIIK